jgi:hypothetical protein
MMRIVLSKEDFFRQRNVICLLALVVVVFGMLFGKYGAGYGLPWWIYYPVPMLLTVLLPSFVLKLNRCETIPYLILSFLPAPFIHFLFSFFLAGVSIGHFGKYLLSALMVPQSADRTRTYRIITNGY